MAAKSEETLRYCAVCNQRRYFRDGKCEMCKTKTDVLPAASPDALRVALDVVLRKWERLKDSGIPTDRAIGYDDCIADLRGALAAFSGASDTQKVVYPGGFGYGLSNNGECAAMGASTGTFDEPSLRKLALAVAGFGGPDKVEEAFVMLNAALSRQSEAGESADHAGQAAWEAAMAFIQDKPGLEKFPLLAECRDAIVNALAIRDASREQRGVEKGLERTAQLVDEWLEKYRRREPDATWQACSKAIRALAHPVSAAGEEEQP